MYIEDPKYAKIVQFWHLKIGEILQFYFSKQLAKSDVWTILELSYRPKLKFCTSLATIENKPFFKGL